MDLLGRKSKVEVKRLEKEIEKLITEIKNKENEIEKWRECIERKESQLRKAIDTSEKKDKQIETLKLGNKALRDVLDEESNIIELMNRIKPETSTQKKIRKLRAIRDITKSTRIREKQDKKIQELLETV